MFLSLPLALTNPSLLVGLDISLNASSECSSSDSIWKVLGFGKAHTLHQLELFQVKSSIIWPQKWCGRWRMEYGDYFLLWEKEKPCSLLRVTLVPWVTEKKWLFESVQWFIKAYSSMGCFRKLNGTFHFLLARDQHQRDFSWVITLERSKVGRKHQNSLQIDTYVLSTRKKRTEK